MDQFRELKDLSPEAFAALGAPILAYIREAVIDGEVVFKIHAADGTTLGVFDDSDDAFAVALEHDLKAVRVH